MLETWKLRIVAGTTAHNFKCSNSWKIREVKLHCCVNRRTTYYECDVHSDCTTWTFKRCLAEIFIHGLTEIFIHCHLEGFSVRKVSKISGIQFGAALSPSNETTDFSIRSAFSLKMKLNDFTTTVTMWFQPDKTWMYSFISKEEDCSTYQQLWTHGNFVAV